MLTNYPDILSVKQVCEILQTSKKTVYTLIRCKKIKAKKVAHHYRVLKQSLINYMYEVES